jgi:diguanylate cyclase (GGDEF)-like protein
MPFFMPIACLVLSINQISSKLFGVIPFAYKKAFEWADNPILILDSDLNLIDYNEEAQACIPLLDEDTVTKNLADFLDYDGRIKSSIVTETECRIRIIKNYNVRHYRVSCSQLLSSQQKILGYMLSLIDVTELVETMAELTELASVDTLTRTHTRRYFIERTELEFARAKRHSHPLSFIILDLDYFKKINDKHGHMAGDAMLKEIADICKTKVRSTDLLGRFGGEEFMILLPETNLESALYVAERIRKKIQETEFEYDGNKMKITASLGVTGTDKITCESFDTFLHCADKALYRAKDNGRNKIEYEVSDKL